MFFCWETAGGVSSGPTYPMETYGGSLQFRRQLTPGKHITRPGMDLWLFRPRDGVGLGMELLGSLQGPTYGWRYLAWTNLQGCGGNSLVSQKWG